MWKFALLPIQLRKRMQETRGRECYSIVVVLVMKCVLSQNSGLPLPRNENNLSVNGHPFPLRSITKLGIFTDPTCEVAG
jgi:hypothetical protein